MGLQDGLARVALRGASIRPFRAAGSSLLVSARKLARGERGEDLGAEKFTALEDADWEVRDREHWLVVGPNGSGKSCLVQALCGRALVVKGSVVHRSDCTANDISYSSHTRDLQILNLVRQVEETGGWERLGKSELQVDRILHHLGCESGVSRMLEDLGSSQLLGRNLAELSTGQLRRVAIVLALTTKRQGLPQIAILDEPFDGLDATSRGVLSQFLTQLAAKMQLILVSHRLSEVDSLPFITHALELGDDSKIAQKGPLSHLHLSYRLDQRKISSPRRDLSRLLVNSPRRTKSQVLVDMQDVEVRFGAQAAILEKITWQIRGGEHWRVQGDSGSGKSLLLGLVSGDTLQLYRNDITFFGSPRGSLSLQSVRGYIGEVSPRIQQVFSRSHQCALDAICTAYFGIQGGPCPPYCTKEQIERARFVASVLDIPESSLSTSFSSLSQGQQRLVLLARALLAGKDGGLPELMLLDEPFHGLDSRRRGLLLQVLGTIRHHTTIVLVSHHDEDIPAFIENTLFLGERGTSTMQGST